MTERVVALLRGINVGGHRKIKMADLRRVLSDAGARNVATYLASGNVAFDTDLTLDAVGEFVSGAVDVELGISDMDVTARSARQIDSVVAGNPWPGADTADLHVLFMGEAAHSRDYGALGLTGYEPEQLVPGAGHVWLRLPGGVSRSPLLRDLPRLLRGSPTAMGSTTMRNWRTFCALRTL